MKSLNIFLRSVGILLLITAFAKLASSVGHATILDTSDPILGLTFRWLFIVAGGIELSVGLTCLVAKSIYFRVGSVAWLATCLIGYCIGLIWLDYAKPCNCLGSLTDAIGIPAGLANVMMEIVLGYLLVGSYAALVWLWRSKRSRPSFTG